MTARFGISVKLIFMKSIITATVPLNVADGTINNLVEADFLESDISLIAENSADARRLIDDDGPLKGENALTLAAALKRLGVAQASNVAALVKKDIVLIVIRTDESSVAAAKEILRTTGATLTE